MRKAEAPAPIARQRYEIFVKKSSFAKFYFKYFLKSTFLIQKILLQQSSTRFYNYKVRSYLPKKYLKQRAEKTCLDFFETIDKEACKQFYTLLPYPILVAFC